MGLKSAAASNTEVHVEASRDETAFLHIHNLD